MQQISLNLGPERSVYSVTQLNREVCQALERKYGDIWVHGEVSGAKHAPSGHWYFTLKDRDAQLRCVIYRSSARYLRFKPQDGIAVQARGKLTLYDARGEFQFLVETLEPQGHGALQLAFEQLKQRLALEGLFASERKRPLPKFPARIGIVTSPKGAAIQDMLNVLTRRYPGLHVRLYPALVQGEGSIESVVDGLRYFASSAWADVVVVARGGGSLEDLWTFNEEAVARAIASVPVPVVSAIGHETDFTIADFVADLRAPTPSAAAELITPSSEQVLREVNGLESRIEKAVRYRVAIAHQNLHRRGVERAAAVLQTKVGRRAQRLDDLESRIAERVRSLTRSGAREIEELGKRLARLDLRLRVARGRHRLEASERELLQCMRDRAAGARRRFERITAVLPRLDPRNVLARGYSLVTTEDGKLVRSKTQAPPGSRISVQLAEGRLKSIVEADE